MYLRPVHSEYDLSILYEFIQTNPLGILTTAITSPNHSTIQVSHIPWVLDESITPIGEDSSAPVAVLRGHLARANPQAKVLIDAAISNATSSTSQNATLDDEILVLFNGPVHHYIPPAFYTETKPLTGKVVPTWNYSAVQAYGKIKVLFDTKDPATDSFLATQIRDLSRQSEEKIMGHDGPKGKNEAWTVEHAPERYIELLKKAIIGVEVEVTRLEGKWKMSQESPEGDRNGVVEGFANLGTSEGDRISAVMRERAEIMQSRKTNKVSA